MAYDRRHAASWVGTIQSWAGITVPPGFQIDSVRKEVDVRVLTVLPDVPLPADTGLHIRMLGNLELVRRLGHESHLIFFSTEERSDNLALVGEVSGLVDGLRHAGMRRPQRDFSLVELARHKADFFFRGTLRRPSRTYPFSMRYDAVGGSQMVLEESREQRADVVILPSIFLHWAAILTESGVQVIADAADVLTDVTRRILNRYDGKSPLARLSLLANAQACHAQERLFLPRCAEVWVTSRLEAERMQKLSAATPIVVVPNTVPDPGQREPAPGGPPVIGFIGTYSYLPNLEAAEFLVTEVISRVREIIPEVVLRVGGAGLSLDLVRRWTQRPGVEILGRVPSSTEFLAGCDIVALPVAMRGGVPLKLVESLALGRPIVAFSELLEGVPLLAGHDIEVVNDPVGFADCIVALLRNTGRATKLGYAGRKAYELNFSRTSLHEHVRGQSLLCPR